MSQSANNRIRAMVIKWISFLTLVLICIAMPSIAARAEGYGGKGDLIPDYPGVTRLDQWMQAFENDIPLNQLNIPGAHDAGTEDIVLVARDGGKCQDLTIEEQLNHGIRVLDIRLEYNLSRDWESLYVCHGIFGCNITLKDVMKPCRNFVLSHPSETVIVYVTYENLWQETTSEIIGDMQKQLDCNRTWNPSSYWNVCRFYHKGDEIPTLGEARGKVIIVSDYKINGEKQTMFNKFEDHASVWDDVKVDWLWKCNINAAKQDWTESGRGKFESFRNGLDDAGCERNDEWLEPDCKWLFTNCNKVPAIGGGPRSLAKKINPQLWEIFYRKGARLGWVFMDFPSDDLIRLIINTNQDPVWIWNSSITFEAEKNPWKSEEDQFDLEEAINDGRIIVTLEGHDLTHSPYSDLYELKMDAEDRVYISGNLYPTKETIFKLQNILGRQLDYDTPIRPMVTYLGTSGFVTKTLSHDQKLEGLNQYDKKSVRVAVESEPLQFGVRFEDNNNEAGDRPVDTDDLVKKAPIKGTLNAEKMGDEPFRFTVSLTEEEGKSSPDKSPYIRKQAFTNDTNKYILTIENLPAVSIKEGLPLIIRHITGINNTGKLPYSVHVEQDEKRDTLVFTRKKTANVEAVIKFVDGDNKHTDPVSDHLSIKLESSDGTITDVTEKYKDYFNYEPTGNPNEYKIGYYGLPPIEANRYYLSVNCEGFLSYKSERKETETKDAVFISYEYTFKRIDPVAFQQIVVRFEDSSNDDRPETAAVLADECLFRVKRTDHDGQNERFYLISGKYDKQTGVSIRNKDENFRTGEDTFTLDVQGLPTLDSEGYRYIYAIDGLERESDRIPYTWSIEYVTDDTPVLVLTHDPVMVILQGEVIFRDGDDAYRMRSLALADLNNGKAPVYACAEGREDEIAGYANFTNENRFSMSVPAQLGKVIYTYRMEYPETITGYKLVSTNGFDAVYELSVDATDVKVEVRWEDEVDQGEMRPQVDAFGGPAYVSSSSGETKEVYVSESTNPDRWVGTTTMSALDDSGEPCTYSMDISAWLQDENHRPSGYDISIWSENGVGDDGCLYYTVVILYERNDNEYRTITGSAEYYEPVSTEHDNEQLIEGLKVLRLGDDGQYYEFDEDEIKWDVEWNGNTYTFVDIETREPYHFISKEITVEDEEEIVKSYSYAIAVTNAEGYFHQVQGFDIVLVKNIAVEGEVSWKDGKVTDNHAPLVTIMREGRPFGDSTSTEPVNPEDSSRYTYHQGGLPYADWSGNTYNYTITITIGDSDAYITYSIEDKGWKTVGDEPETIDPAGIRIINAEIEAIPAKGTLEIRTGCNILMSNGTEAGDTAGLDKAFTVCLDSTAEGKESDVQPEIHAEGKFTPDNGYTFDFEIAFAVNDSDIDKTYTLYLRQKQTGDENWDVDDSVYPVEIKAYYLNGQVAFRVENYPADTAEERFVFKNIYTPKPAVVTLDVKNKVRVLSPEGYGITPPEMEFTYELMTDQARPVVLDMFRATSDDNPPEKGYDVVFDELTFKAEGEYTYQIVQTARLEDGWYFDSEPHKVTITVTDKDGSLEATMEPAEVIFDNRFIVGVIDFKIAKEVLGIVDGNAIDEDFSFVTVQQQDTDLRGEVTINRDSFVQGKSEGRFDPLIVRKEGTYSYLVWEEAGSGNWNYDTAVKTLTAAVTKESEDKPLKVELSAESVPFRNEYEPPTVKVYVQWDDVNNEFLRPQSVDVDLCKVVAGTGETVKVGEQITLSNPDGSVNVWDGVFTGLPRYESDGQTEIQYSVRPVVPEDYEMEGPIEKIADRTFVITLRPVDSYLDVQVLWEGDEDYLYLRPEALKVYVLGDGDVYRDRALDAEEEWHYTFTDLPVRKLTRADGAASIAYTVEADAVLGYSKAITGNVKDGFKVIYSFGGATEAVVKWEADKKSTRPSAVTLKVMEKKTSSPVIEIEVKAEDDWKKELAAPLVLPEYVQDTDGNTVKAFYAVVPSAVRNYKAKGSFSGSSSLLGVYHYSPYNPEPTPEPTPDPTPDPEPGPTPDPGPKPVVDPVDEPEAVSVQENIISSILNTGDESNMMLYLVVMSLSFAAMMGVVVVRKRR